MTKGDSVIAVLAAGGSLQPAAGIEIMITAVSTTAAIAASNWVYYNDAVRGAVACTSAAAPLFCVLKMPITNAIFIHTPQGGACGGIQIK